MAAPTVVSVGAVASTAFGSSRTPTLPASLSNGNMLVCVAMGSLRPATPVVSSVSGGTGGWTELTQKDNGSAEVWVSVFYRIIDGTEINPTVTISANTSWGTYLFQVAGQFSNPVGAIESAFSIDDSEPIWAYAGFASSRADSLMITHAQNTFSAADDQMTLPSGYTNIQNGVGNPGAFRTMYSTPAAETATPAISEDLTSAGTFDIGTITFEIPSISLPTLQEMAGELDGSATFGANIELLAPLKGSFTGVATFGGDIWVRGRRTFTVLG